MRALALPLLVLASLTGCLTSSEDFQAMLAYASDEDLDGYAPRDGDCDDFDASVHPGAEDVWYDGVDRDCDDWNDNDADHDGSPIPDDCDDTDPLVSPDFEEECDGVDEDCDGQIDEGMSGFWYADADGDGQGNPATEVTTCLPPEGYVDVGGDCEDADPAVYSGAVEVCGDGVVNDCAGYDGSCRVEGEVSLGEGGGEVVHSVLWGDGDQDLFGSAVALGQFDGEGGADVVVGAPLHDLSGRDAGAAHVLFSPLEGGEQEMPDDAFVSFTGSGAGHETGVVIGTSGDFGNDGKEEILIVSTNSSFGNHGIVHVANVPSSPGQVDLSLVSRALLFPEVYAGGALQGLGDVDDDGGNEVAIGHVGANGGAGAVYVWGYFDGAQDIDRGDAVVHGEQLGDGAGAAIAEASDFNGDGLNDLLLGAPHHDSDRGAVYLIEGPLAGSYNLASSDAKLTGEDRGDLAGTAVAGGADVDGDGLDDLVIGAPAVQLGQDEYGKVYLFTSTPTGTLDISNAARTFVGDTGKAEFGVALSLSSDLDGDSLGDLVIAARSQDSDIEAPGAIFVFFEPLLGTAGPEGAELTLWGESQNDTAGHQLQSGHDVNGDGHNDLLIGSPQYHRNGQQPGAAHLLLSSGP